MRKHIIAAGILAAVAIVLTIIVALEANDLVIATGIPAIIGVFEFFYLLKKNNNSSRFTFLHLLALYSAATWIGFIVLVWVLFIMNGGVNIY